jgi:hypothetical protein
VIFHAREMIQEGKKRRTGRKGKKRIGYGRRGSAWVSSHGPKLRKRQDGPKSTGKLECILEFGCQIQGGGI